MNVYIYLDIDGVFATEGSLNKAYNSFLGQRHKGTKSFAKDSLVLEKYRPMVSMYHWPFDQIAIDNFHKLQVEIVNMGHTPQVVITSTWRLKFRNKAIEILAVKGLYLMNIHGKTRWSNNDRGQEIKDYIEDNDVELSAPMIIIDDETKDIRPYFEDNYIVETTFFHGFSRNCLDRAIKSIEEQFYWLNLNSNNFHIE